MTHVSHIRSALSIGPPTYEPINTLQLRCEAAEQREMTLITAKAVAPLPVASVRDFLVGRGSTKPFPQRAFVLVRLGGVQEQRCGCRRRVIGCTRPVDYREITPPGTSQSHLLCAARLNLTVHIRYWSQ